MREPRVGTPAPIPPPVVPDGGRVPRDELHAPRDIARLTRYGERFGPHKIDVRWLPLQLPVTGPALEHGERFNVVRMREHIHRLNLCYFIFFIQDGKVPGLRGRVATYIYNSWGIHLQDLPAQFFMHACAWRIGNDHIRFAVLCKKFIIANIYHIAGNKMGMVNII